MSHKKVDFLVIGGGLTGCLVAKRLQEAKKSYLLVEKSNTLGGRIRSHQIKGFTIDEGFQVSLTSYPWVESLLKDHQSNFFTFDSGAIILTSDSKRSYFLNPLKHPLSILKTLKAPALSSSQILPLLKALIRSPESVQNLSAKEFINKIRFSSEFQDQFFRPFFGGIFLDPNLQPSAALFVYLYRLFAFGKAFVPKAGIGQLIEWITKDLEKTNVLLNTEVKTRQQNQVTLSNGEVIQAQTIIQACNLDPNFNFNSTHCYWVSIPKQKVICKLITLNGDSVNPILHSSLISHVNPHYAPKGFDLVTITTTEEISSQDIKAWVTRAYTDLHGADIELIAYQHIKKALPQFRAQKTWNQPGYLKQGSHFEIGDHTSFPSQQGVANAVENLMEVILN
jgi:protoporphyrinogen oxidase